MGIGVHQLAILQGSEVAHVERALVRAPAAFLGFEAHKEGHHFRSCKPGFCLAFCFMVTSVSFHPVHRARPVWIISQKRTCVAIRSFRGASGSRRIIPQRRTWVTPRSSRRFEPGSRPDYRRITSRYHAQTVVDLFRNAKFDPHSNPLAAPNLGSPALTPPRSHCEETENKKPDRIATFLRLAIVMGSSDRGTRCKSAGNRLFSSVFLL